jgi:esterase/lipase superfamily enzyme
MEKASLYYATNRAHYGNNRWKPKGYGKNPSSDGAENLRFGKLTMNVDRKKVDKYLSRDIDFGVGDGSALSGYLKDQCSTIKIEAFEETINQKKPDIDQAAKNFGSSQAFKELQQRMKQSEDVLIYIHGFNVSWEDAVAAALALQYTLNVDDSASKATTIFLFSWPSDGMALPYVSYKSDRSDAELSGNGFGRGVLKLRDLLVRLRSRDTNKNMLCKQELHLLCHSMGNYVLQNTLQRIKQFNHGQILPRLFDHIFMCAPDVDESIFEPGQALESLPEMARSISVYHNKGDLAMYVSDYTKSNPDRLGQSGAAKPASLHNKIHQIDCSDIVSGRVEHSYYLDGRVNKDIRASIAGVKHDSEHRDRRQKGNAWPNVWVMV